jgi:hypothetical protein
MKHSTLSAQIDVADYGVPLEYQPRTADSTVLYQVIQEHWQTFVNEHSSDNRSVPYYITQHFERFMQCGIPAYGAVRVACEHCGKDFLVPFSCKGRGLCPSCTGRRASELAATMVDHLFPSVPVRQYVLTFPFPLRLWLASRKDLLARVCRLACTIIKEFILTRSSHQSISCIDHFTTGLVAFVQRFGSALNLNPHFHIVALDGAYDMSQDEPVFLTMAKPDNESIALLARRLCENVNSLLIDEGFLCEDGEDLRLADTTGLFQPDVDTELHLPAMAGSITQRIAFGPRAGQPVQRLRTADSQEKWPDPEQLILGPRCASFGGYNLHANTSIAGNNKVGLEKLLGYAARGPISDERLERIGENTIQVRLKTPWKDGTTHLVFSLSEFIEKLVALIPPPWFHMVRYFGVFVSNAEGREAIVPRSDTNAEAPKKKGRRDPEEDARRRRRRMRWADLLQRVFAVDVKKCKHCGGDMHLVQTLFPSEALSVVLKMLKLPTSPPKFAPVKAAQFFFD